METGVKKNKNGSRILLIIMGLALISVVSGNNLIFLILPQACTPVVDTGEFEDVLDDFYSALEDRELKDLEDLVTGDLEEELEEADDDDNLDAFWSKYGAAKFEEILDIDVSRDEAEVMALVEIGEEQFEQEVIMELSKGDWLVAELKDREIYEEDEDDDEEDADDDDDGEDDRRGGSSSDRRAVEDRIVEFHKYLRRGNIDGAYAMIMTSDIEVNARKQSDTLVKLSMVGEGVIMYMMDNNDLPEATNIEELEKILFDGGYIEGAEKYRDAWGNKLAYARTDSGGYRIISYGSDGRPGPSTENEYVVNTLAEDLIWEDGSLAQRISDSVVGSEDIGEFVEVGLAKILDTEVDGDEATAEVLFREDDEVAADYWTVTFSLEKDGRSWKIASFGEPETYRGGSVLRAEESDIRRKVEGFMATIQNLDFSGMKSFTTEAYGKEFVTEGMEMLAEDPDQLNEMRERMETVRWEILGIDVDDIDGDAIAHLKVAYSEGESIRDDFSDLTFWLEYGEWKLGAIDNVDPEGEEF